MRLKNLLSALLPILFIVVFAHTTELQAQDNFSGKMVFEISEGNGSPAQQLEYFSNGDNIAVDMNIEGMESSILIKNEKIYMIMHAMKMYMEMPQNFDMSDDDVAEFEQEFINNITKTDDTKEILGYTCKKWIAKDESEVVEIWVTEELGSFMFPENIDEGDAPFWTKAFGDNFFPLQLTEKDADGGDVSNFEVIEITPMEVEAAKFELPAGYQKMDPDQF